MEQNSRLIMVLEALGRTDVVELSELLESPLNSTIRLVEALDKQGIVETDRFGHIYYKKEERTMFKITPQNIPTIHDQIMSFITTLRPEKFQRQRRMIQNQIDGIQIEWELVQKLMEDEDDFICRWEPFGPVRDIEISFKAGEKMVFVQVKSSKSSSLRISESDCDRLREQYGKTGYFAFKIDDLPYYFVSCEDVQGSEVRTIDPMALISQLSSHYDISTFKEGIKKCLIP